MKGFLTVVVWLVIAFIGGYWAGSAGEEITFNPAILHGEVFIMEPSGDTYKFICDWELVK